MFETSEQPAVMQEQAAELESGISHTQASIARAHKRKHQLQGQNTRLQQRLRQAIAAIDAIVSAPSLVPDTPVVPDPVQGACCYAFNFLVVVLYMVCLQLFSASGVRFYCSRKYQVGRCTSIMLQAPTSLEFHPH